MPEDDEPRQEAPKSILPESIKKALVTGISAAFMTEEAIRGALSDMRLPKEAAAYILQQTSNSRKELFRVISDELKSFLKNVDVASAARKALDGMRLEVKAEIKFVDEGKGKLTAKVSTEEEHEGGRRKKR